MKYLKSKAVRMFADAFGKHKYHITGYNMKRVGRGMLVAGLFCTMLCCFSCKGDRRLVIGVSQCSEDIWRDKLNEELAAAAYFHNNIELRIVSADDDDMTQIKQIDRFVDEGIDLLIVSPNQMTVTPAIDRAFDKGIPVILFDRKTDSEKYTAFIGADNVAVGRAIGNYVAGMLGGRGRVAEIMGLEGSSPAIERHQGFMEALSLAPGIEYLGSRYGTWLQESGSMAMDTLMDRLGDIDCVFAQNDRMALGAYEVAKSRGKDGNMKFVGIDALSGEKGGIRLVRDGVLDASCIYPTRGDLVIRLAVNILEGKPFARDNYMQAALVTEDNANVLLMQEEERASLNERLKILHGKVDLYIMQYNHQKVYLVLCVIIIMLCIFSFVFVYRMIIVKRRAAEEAANAKLVYFTNISHEFRTPLTLIADPVNRLLEDATLGETQRGLLQVVKNNTNVLLRLIGEILDLRKIQNGKMKLELNRFDLSECMAQWMACFGPMAEWKRITMKLEAGDGLMLCADMNKVERICYNLLSNALKYTPEGGSVTFSAVREGKQVRISVADTGIGIPKDSIGHVFDRFFRVKGNNMTGTGIGLAIVKAFADMHHGRVSVESEEGKGSTFSVVLPWEQKGVVAEPAGREAFVVEEVPLGKQLQVKCVSAADRITAAEGEASDNRPTVLVVEDNDEVRGYIAMLLQTDYKVQTASHGKDGLDVALREVPDIIVSDVMMPVMDGLEMCRRLKAEMATCHIPVLLLTARSFENQRAEGYDCGADSYLIKPFDGKVLLARVRNLLDGRKRLKYVWLGSTPEEEVAKPCDNDSRFISDFRNVVQSHLSDSDLNVEQVSAEMGFSRVQLYRKVKALTGYSPVELIRITRLKRAEYLLRTTGKTVSEIAYEVGFSSPSYFGKCFKEHFKILPTEVRG